MGGSYSAVAVANWLVDGPKYFGKRGFEMAKASWLERSPKFDFTGKTACVTGANAGIGYATALSFASSNATVHMICRNEQRGLEAQQRIVEDTGNDNVFLHVVDISSNTEVNNFAPIFIEQCPKLDILINNAMVMPQEYSESADGNELCLATMLGGSYLLTSLLIPQMLKSSSACVINVTSGGMYTVKARVDDLNCRNLKYDPVLVYAFTKRAQVHVSEILAKKLAETSIKVHSMHPGWVSTPGLQTSMPDFYEKNKGNLRTAEEGTDTILWLANHSEELETGRFWFDRKIRKTHYRFARTHLSTEQIERLWENIQTLSGYQWQQNF
mmetsp:Transcript_970/g.1214  ORF Transcript_970/g.1214 Transcript_970/m.1214 type:complete len:327 (+) Transcript_970:93-1073(+)